ncbi:MAG: DUF308 domain-containing protein [Clostridia bacterium]|nr:DUF308 domain-containing protein [Clostridia bacterium]
MTKKANSNLVSAILYIVIGVLLIVFRSQTLNWAMTIAGIFFVVSGILDLTKQNWSSGAINLVIGIAVLVLGWVATAIVLLVFGIMMAVKGVVALIEALKSKKDILALVFPILTVVAGLALAFGRGLDVVLIICGVLLVVDGALGLLSATKK